MTRLPLLPLAVVLAGVLLTGCGSRGSASGSREASHLSSGSPVGSHQSSRSREGSQLSPDPTAYATLREAIKNDLRRETRMFRAAEKCASIRDVRARKESNCVTDFASRASRRSWNEHDTYLIVGLLDTSEATSECRSAIEQLGTEEDNTPTLPSLLVKALGEPSPKTDLEEAGTLWSLLKNARRTALAECR